jgi:hypothetical protein
MVAGTFENVCMVTNPGRWEERSRCMRELVFPGYFEATSGSEKRLIGKEIRQREIHGPKTHNVIRQVTTYNKSVSI